MGKLPLIFFRLLLLLIVGIPTTLAAQTDTGMSLLDDTEPVREKVQNAFKTSKIINLQSMEVTDAGVMDMKINHRFGAINQGAYEAFGLDNAVVRIGAEYGLVPNLSLNFGRSSLDKLLDAGLKYRFMHQTTDNKKPLSMLLYGGWARVGGQSVQSRYWYTGQLIIGRKMTDKLSVQLVPSVVIAPSGQTYALGMGFRQKLTQRTTFNMEYIPVLIKPEGRSTNNYYNSLSVGVDIETGGHVFQLHFTNSSGMAEPQFIAQNTGTWTKQEIRFGFNISRVFTVVDPSRFN